MMNMHPVQHRITCAVNRVDRVDGGRRQSHTAACASDVDQIGAEHHG